MTLKEALETGKRFRHISMRQKTEHHPKAWLDKLPSGMIHVVALTAFRIDTSLLASARNTRKRGR